MYMVSEEELKKRHEMVLVAGAVMDKIEKRILAVPDHGAGKDLKRYFKEDAMGLLAEVILILMQIHPEYKEGFKN